MASTRVVVVEKKTVAKDVIEVKRYATCCLEQGLTRSGKVGKTPLRQLKYLDKKAAENCRWKLNMNFKGGDIFATFCYLPYQKIEPEQVKKNINTFLDTLRRIYRRNGKKLIYVYAVGMTKKGIPHIHMVMNRFDTAIITSCWQKIVMAKTDKEAPRVTIRHLDNSGEYKKLAEYLIKNTREQFYSKNKVHAKRFCASKGLKMPLIEKRIFKRFWSKLPKALPGYIIDKNSVYDTYGWSDVGGCFEQCRVQGYTMYKIDNRKIRKSKNRKIYSSEGPIIIKNFVE